MAQLIALDPERLRINLGEVRERIASACSRAGRDPADIEMLAATKYIGVKDLGALANAGITLIGENIAGDLADKHERWGDRFTYDFIGHLQSRKAKQVLPLVRLIHSVESESVIRQLERHAGGGLTVLLEVNLAQEASKYGVDPGAVDGFLEHAEAYENVRFAGLMTMPPLAAEPEEARPYFSALRELAERLDRDWGPRHDFSVLSMGTSQDFEVAIEEGATVLRLGSVLYA
jgi:pyridoxal phosphate enzyme (YggS family)